MADHFGNVKFKYSFRDYQQEALENYRKHLSDNKIHIVAAPGAGKTILALEICRRIGRKTLVMVPSVAVKEQWIERFAKDFDGVEPEKDISSGFDAEANSAPMLTVITYQMLHSMFRRGEDLPALIRRLGIGTVVLDECHHMRRAWFYSLRSVMASLDGCSLISITATPPYDNGTEFRNYMDLCGDIDDRITVGQLVRSGCLCPHQDYIYFNLPSAEQRDLMCKLRSFSDSLTEELLTSEKLITAVALNDNICFPEDNLDSIYRDFDFYVAMCSYLDAAGCSFGSGRLGTAFRPPRFDKEKLALILERYIFGKIPEAKIIKDYLSELRNRLELAGCIDEKHVDLICSAELSTKILADSGKLDSICDIVNFEYDNLGRSLNMAVCTDYIRKEYYSARDEKDIDEIGVIPIFRRLRADCPQVDMAVLTGTLIYIPSRLGELFREIAAAEHGISEEDITVRELGIDFDYSAVEIAGDKKRHSVAVVTRLFETNELQVLIGTIALIGEGWDAPFINSLIIASSVSTYVTSNQVRGRAIRIDRAVPDKVSNIWHLVTMEERGDTFVTGRDYLAVSERFIGFEGLNSEADAIESGIERLNIRTGEYTEGDVYAANRKTLAAAADREETGNAWQRALVNYEPEYYEHISDRAVSQIYTAGIGFVRRHHVVKMTAILVRALKTAGKLPEAASFKVEYSKRNGYRIKLVNADTNEQIMFANAVRQQYETGSRTKYVLVRFGKIYPVPDILGNNRKSAELYRKATGFRFTGLLYIRSDEGMRLLLRRRLTNGFSPAEQINGAVQRY